MNNQIPKAPLKDRMIVYVGVASIILVSWAYIIGMGWHMGTLPFSEPMQMDMNTMDMDKMAVSYTHLRAHETPERRVWRIML